MANLLSTTITGTLTEKTGTASLSGNTLTVDMSTGSYFEVDMADAGGDISTFTITNPPASGKVGSFTLKVIQDQYFTWRDFNWGSMSGADPYWKDNSPPKMTDKYKSYNIFSFITFDQGSSWYGTLVGKSFPKIMPVANIWGERGVFGGGTETVAPPVGHASNMMDYIAIDTLSNASDFGDLTIARSELTGVSDGTRGVWGCGWGAIVPGPSPRLANIDYITIATSGDATVFGDSTVARGGSGGVSGGGRGVFAGGWYTGVPDGGSTIDYITIATTGNATTFGSVWSGALGVTNGDRDVPGAVSNGTRGVFGGGYIGEGSEPHIDVIDYITIATTGNSAEFGTLTLPKGYLAGASDATRGVFSHGKSDGTTSFTRIDYITIGTPANASIFGVGDVDREKCAGTGDGYRGIFAASTISPYENTIEYITIATTGNGTTFATLNARCSLSALSGD